MFRILRHVCPSSSSNPFFTGSFTCRCLGLTYPRYKYHTREEVTLSSSQPPSNVTSGDPLIPLVFERTPFFCSRLLRLSLTSSAAKWRAYSTKRGRGKKVFGEDDHEYSDDEDETGDEEGLSDTDDDDDEAVSGSKNWKDISMHVPSLRVDAILSAGLGISRKKIDDTFYEGRLRQNDNIIAKKSKTVKQGDIIDLIIKGKGQSDGEKAAVPAVMRVKVKKIGEEKTAKERIPVQLRRWKYLEI